MDYTADQQENLHPGKYNFDLLAALYGNADPSNNETIEKQRSPSALRRNWNRKTQIDFKTLVPEIVYEQFDEAAKRIESTTCVDCAIAIGDGYEIVAHRIF